MRRKTVSQVFLYRAQLYSFQILPIKKAENLKKLGTRVVLFKTASWSPGRLVGPSSVGLSKFPKSYTSMVLSEYFHTDKPIGRLRLLKLSIGGYGTSR